MKAFLGIETSCDECSASVVSYEPLRMQTRIKVKSVATHSQIKEHQPYGGVVPEIASRNHLETINPMIDRALQEAEMRISDLQAIAVSNRPGLVGSLLVGVTAAKALAYASGKPLVPVHHLEGHIASLYLDLPPEQTIKTPMILLLVSGGHTCLFVSKSAPELWPPDFLNRSLIGHSRDDAAGEAFDKTAKILGFSYPGGKWIDTTSKSGNPKAYDLPRALPQKDTFDFSFSGLKTAVSQLTQKIGDEKKIKDQLPDLCASVQEAIVDALLKKVFLAQEKYGGQSIAVVGGVAANSRLRARLEKESSVPVYFPHLDYCTDNAAMIAAAGAFRFLQGGALSDKNLLTLNAIANPRF